QRSPPPETPCGRGTHNSDREIDHPPPPRDMYRIFRKGRRDLLISLAHAQFWRRVCRKSRRTGSGFAELSVQDRGVGRFLARNFTRHAELLKRRDGAAPFPRWNL